MLVYRVLRIGSEQIALGYRLLPEHARASRNDPVESGWGLLVQERVPPWRVLTQSESGPELMSYQRERWTPRALHISDVDEHIAAKLLLHIEVPLLHIRVCLVGDGRLNALANQGIDEGLGMAGRDDPIRKWIAQLDMVARVEA